MKMRAVIYNNRFQGAHLSNVQIKPFPIVFHKEHIHGWSLDIMN